ncbi:MAG TPA: hypothetical protein VH349_02360 [Ktedonobacterales bacterium]
MTQRIESSRASGGICPLGWAGYAAAIWAFLFAATSFYWALGGRLSVETNR